MTSRSFNELLKEEKGEKYIEELDAKVQQEIEKHKDEECVYVKNNEDYAAYKPKSLVSADDIVISEKEYNKIVGNKIEKYTRGGSRKGAGRRKIFEKPKRVTYEFEEDTIIKLKDYAKKHKKSQNELINEAVKRLINS